MAILRQMGASEVFFLCLAQTPTSAKSDEKCRKTARRIVNNS
ncbi:MAG: hypothetical protein ACLUB2_04045 [Butyricicoccus pullicaecorum]